MQQFTRRRWTTMFLTLALVLVIGLAACGGDDEDNGDEEAAETPTVEPTATEEPAAAEEPTATEEPAAEEPTATEEPAAGDDEPEETAMGDATNGQQIFTDVGCSGCHAVDTDEALAGPSLMGIANVAGDRVEGMSAEEYLQQAIVAPDEHIVEGFEAGIMQSYSDQLDEQQINDLVAYLMSLDG